LPALRDRRHARLLVAGRRTALVAAAAIALAGARPVLRDELVDVEGEAHEEIVRVRAIRHAAGLPLDALDLGGAARVVLALVAGDLLLPGGEVLDRAHAGRADRKSTRLNSSHVKIS